MFWACFRKFSSHAYFQTGAYYRASTVCDTVTFSLLKGFLAASKHTMAKYIFCFITSEDDNFSKRYFFAFQCTVEPRSSGIFGHQEFFRYCEDFR